MKHAGEKVAMKTLISLQNRTAAGRIAVFEDIMYKKRFGTKIPLSHDFFSNKDFSH